MTSERFVNQNRTEWDRWQSMLDDWKEYSPTELGDAYLSVCSDLAYAQSHYPDTQVCKYLNALALQYHHILYRRQPQRWTELWHFFKHTVPMSFYESRRYLLFALALFVLGQVIGVIQQCLDEDYFRFFFGSAYYETSLDNIEEGNPMGIYGMQSEVEMFFAITLNNISVGFIYFLSGLLTPFYVIYSTVITGIMDGCFMAFFFQHNEGLASLIAPNEHGSLELPSIIVCSAAGIKLGIGWFFPGQMTRMRALVKSAQDAVIMVLATVPVFVVAGFIESFITRHQEWPMSLKLLFVAMGLVASIYYIVILPRQLKRKEGNHDL